MYDARDEEGGLMSQVWLVTGSSRGLGRAIADAALDAGHSVTATARGELRSTEVPEGDRLLPLRLDVTARDEQAYTDVVDAAVSRFGRIDVLVNNAGYGLITAFEETDEEDLRAVFETNVFGLMRLTRAVLPVMRRQRSGHIFNVSSAAGYRPSQGPVPYKMSKFAVTGFSMALAAEVQPFGIAVTNVAPGMFRSDFLDQSSIRLDPGRPLEDYAASRAFMTDLIQKANHAQTGDPAALGRLLVEVASSESPPLHLPVGADGVDAMEELQRSLAQDLDVWRERSVATAYTTT
jgi:NAD(P)-dependent dehydrogenase (short-subunit alcohol dehydrogenase family)